MVVLAVSVMIHKIPVSFTVGTTFHKNNRGLLDTSTIVFFIMFILSTPIGMSLGFMIG